MARGSCLVERVPQEWSLSRFRREMPPRAARPTDAEVAALVSASWSGDESAQRRLIESHLWLTLRLAYRYRGNGVPVEDLLQEGNEILVSLLHRPAWVRGSFTAYASFVIRRHLRVISPSHSRHCRRTRTSPQRPSHRRVAVADASGRRRLRLLRCRRLAQARSRIVGGLARTRQRAGRRFFPRTA